MFGWIPQFPKKVSAAGNSHRTRMITSAVLRAVGFVALALLAAFPAVAAPEVTVLADGRRLERTQRSSTSRARRLPARHAMRSRRTVILESRMR
jgi:hypothetical protein